MAALMWRDGSQVGHWFLHSDERSGGEQCSHLHSEDVAICGRTSSPTMRM